jgi:hypothetical protein
MLLEGRRGRRVEGLGGGLLRLLLLLLRRLGGILGLLLLVLLDLLLLRRLLLGVGVRHPSRCVGRGTRTSEGDGFAGRVLPKRSRWPRSRQGGRAGLGKGGGKDG